MSQQNQQLDLKGKSITELKALAFDLQNVAQQYQQVLQQVSLELNSRIQEEAAKQNGAEKTETLQKAAAKSKKLSVVKE